MLRAYPQVIHIALIPQKNLPEQEITDSLGKTLSLS